jgi:hypothetical protein
MFYCPLIVVPKEIKEREKRKGKTTLLLKEENGLV